MKELEQLGEIERRGSARRGVPTYTGSSRNLEAAAVDNGRRKPRMFRHIVLSLKRFKRRGGGNHTSLLAPHSPLRRSHIIH